MIGETLNALPGIVIPGYESLVQSFGSPYVLVAISITLVALAAVELCLRRCRKPAEVA